MDDVERAVPLLATVGGRGETTELLKSIRENAGRTLESAADMHECTVEY